jgi:ABC-type Fe3+-hydroxamate transport system substrate-binding protein
MSPKTAAPILIAAAALLLAGCASSAPVVESTPAPTNAGACEQVAVVVDFGPLDEPSVAACAEAGLATDILAASGITTEGTVDYGDQVICRVNGEPSADTTVTIDGAAPFVETCQTLNAAAYWALWVKNTPDGEWEYAQEGATSLELEDGQSVGLVYTPGTESVPPQG